jgi:hypothetical protein
LLLEPFCLIFSLVMGFSGCVSSFQPSCKLSKGLRVDRVVLMYCDVLRCVDDGVASVINEDQGLIKGAITALGVHASQSCHCCLSSDAPTPIPSPQSLQVRDKALPSQPSVHLACPFPPLSTSFLLFTHLSFLTQRCVHDLVRPSRKSSLRASRSLGLFINTQLLCSLPPRLFVCSFVHLF